MFYYKVDFDINTFKFWGGAKDRMEGATDDQIEKVADRLDEYFAGCADIENIPTDTTINDIVWFECDDIFFPDDQDNDE